MTFNDIELTTACPKEPRQFNRGTKKKPDWINIGHDEFCRCNGTAEILTKAGEELLDFIKKHGRFADEEHGHSF